MGNNLLSGERDKTDSSMLTAWIVFTVYCLHLELGAGLAESHDTTGCKLRGRNMRDESKFVMKAFILQNNLSTINCCNDSRVVH